LKAWLDKEQIPPGRWFQDVIQAAIPNVKSAAIFIGQQGLGRWQALELRSFISQCVENGIPVIPVLLPGVDSFPDTLPFLKELNGIRFSRVDDEDALDSLEWGIRGTHPRDAGTPGPTSGKATPKKTPARARATKPTPKTPAAVTSSGDWALLDGQFYQVEAVTRNADGTIAVKIASQDAKVEAAIHALDPASSRSSKRIGFAYGNDGLLVKVRSVQSESKKGGWLWTLILAPEQINYGGGIHESSYQGPEGSFTAEEIVELRARRILLNDPAKDTKKKPGWGMLESLISGGGSLPLPVEGCPIQTLYPSMKQQPRAFLEQARLAAILGLKGGDVVERVLDLTLGPIKKGKVHVKFKGIRRQKYSNVAPTTIEVDGDCALG
jgi:hypothetical protein